MTTIDDIGFRAGAAARTDAEAMARALVEPGLRGLRDRDGAIVTMPSRDPRPRRWAAFAAAVALAAAAVAAIVLYANHGNEKAIVPATDVTTPPTNAPQSTVPPTTDAPQSTTVETTPVTTVTPTIPADAIAVSYDNLPQPLPTPLAITIGSADIPLVAISDTQLVSVSGKTATLRDPMSLDSPGQDVPLDVTPMESIAVGPGDVLYTFDQDSGPMKIAAIALSGDQAGRVIKSADVSRQPSGVINSGALGHGSDGIIDRETGQQLLSYVDDTGAPTTLGHPAHMVATISGQPANGGNVVIRDPDGNHDWSLYIGMDPAFDVSLALNTGPFPSSRGGAVLSMPIDASHQVLAVLAGDGSGQWYSLTDGWHVAASDVGGTVLVRNVGGQVALAKLDPPERLDFLNQPLGLNERVAYAVTKPTNLTSAPPCTIDQLQLAPSADGAMGTTYGVLFVRNQSDTACTITGVPDVAFLDDAGNVVQSTDPSTFTTPGDALILEHDSWAMSELGPIASNVCGGNQSTKFRLTLDGASTTVPLAVGGPVDPSSCSPPQGQSSGAGALTPQPFTIVPPNDGGFNPFDGLHVSIEAPDSVKAGDTLRYDVLMASSDGQQSIADPFCPIYTETLANASGQFLLNCNGSDGVSIGNNEPTVFHIELAIPADAPLGPSTLTWTPVEPTGPTISATVTIVA